MLMQTVTVQKRLEALGGLARQDKRINGLFRLLASPVIWYEAYAAIHANRGALTPGVDGVTLDGFSEERVQRLIAAVMGGSYRPTPVRRVYIPKASGKLRPLGLPSGDDKLVQAAVKLILERIYEPIFTDRSHGFRPGRSCHTALEQIKHGWTGVKWLVDVDLQSFFDPAS
jgi:RNA-directed DNA polymerase